MRPGQSLVTIPLFLKKKLLKKILFLPILCLFFISLKCYCCCSCVLLLLLWLLLLLLTRLLMMLAAALAAADAVAALAAADAVVAVLGMGRTAGQKSV
jgi:hypothetical protein